MATPENPVTPHADGARLPGEPASGAPLAADGSETAKSNPGGFAHLKPLDGVRGLAILLVLVYHFFWGNDVSGSAFLQFMIHVIGSLWIGVDLFFALSGFLITGILFDALNSKHFLRNFYGRRSLRIFPLYYLCLGFVALIVHMRHVHWNGFQRYFIFYLANFPGWQLHRPAALVMASHLWSLSTEEQFYLIWPFVVLLVRDRRRLMNVALILSGVALVLRIVLVLGGASPSLTYTMLPMRMDGLLVGGWLALAIRGPNREMYIRRSRYVLAAAASVLVAIAFVQHGLKWSDSRTINSVGYSLTAIACTALIAVTLEPRAALARICSRYGLPTLGRYSYGIYVWHPIMAESWLPGLRMYLDARTGSNAIGLILSSSVAVVVSILVGMLSYHIFEVHFLRLKRFFSYGR